MSGYFRAPLRVGVRKVKGETDYHSPWLADGGYGSFNYTRIQESDWAELFLSMGTPRVTATVGLMAWLFSGSQSNTDATRPGQLGIAHAYLTFRVPEPFGRDSALEVRAGTFWDRYGYLGKYDTYMFGRLHQMGEHLKATLKVGELDVELVHGLGTYRENNLARAEGGGPARGFTLLHQVTGSIAYRHAFKLAGYYIDSWTKDARSDIGHKNNGLTVAGADLTLSGSFLGTLYVAATRVRAERAAQVAPAIEVLHSFGGAGIMANYLGPDSGGTGTVWSVGAQYDYSLARLGRALRGLPDDSPVTRDVVLGLFGLYAHVDSKQAAIGPVGDGVDKMKIGTDVTFDPLSWLALSARYDWVSEQLDDSGLSFRAISPRITFRSQWLAKEQLYVQYSRYFYGDDVRAPAGDTAPLHVGAPDEHVVKLQAQIGL